VITVSACRPTLQYNAATHLNCRHLLISFSKCAISYNKFCSFKWCWSIFSFAYKMTKGLLKFTQWTDNTKVWQGNSFIAAALRGCTIQPHNNTVHTLHEIMEMCHCIAASIISHAYNWPTLTDIHAQTSKKKCWMVGTCPVS